MIPLTVRSGYSLLWGVSSVRALCREAKRLGYERLALTDTDNLYGLWPFLAACRHEGIRPIIGAEVTDRKGPGRAVCLVKDAEGYSRLCRLLTLRHIRHDFDLAKGLAGLSKGLVVLTSSPALLKAGHDAGIDIFAAMPRHPLPYTHPLVQTARRLGISVVATPGSFFIHPADISIHRILRAIDKNTSLSRLGRHDAAPADAYLCSPQEYMRRFSACPEAVSNTFAVAERINFDGPDFGRVMPAYDAGGDEKADADLRKAAYAGARLRYGELSGAVVNRLEKELKIISAMGFSGYFLIVADIVSNSPRTCGRGSGAASLVAYCLGITNVCPLRHNLYFERFLNPGRTDPPDIDVDFAWDERDSVIARVLEKYAGRAAMVSNHVRFRLRMAVRETARVFGLPEAEIGRVTRRLPESWPDEDCRAGSKGHAAGHPRIHGIDISDPWPEILSIARQIIGLPRSISVHPGGVVITPDPIGTYVPVQKASKQIPVLQWDKDAVEEAGLVKIDLLGNRSLAVIRDALANLRENSIKIDEHKWMPEDDPMTRASIAKGRTMGCFYIESPAMRLLQQKTGAGDFEHLVIHSSIIRPAANEVIQEYIRRLHGGAWEPVHPLLEEVLAETLGLMIYQDDVSRVAVHVAGFSHAEADALRKIMSKKDREHELKDYMERFVSGAQKRGLDDRQIAKIWRMIMSFNGYSFCKAHSASYARVSFQSAYLKAHHPAEFMAAVISNQGGFYSTFAYVSEAMRMGLTLLPPDVGKSKVNWTGRGRHLRVGLVSIQNLSADTRDRIVSERQKRPYSDLTDFLDRIRPDETEARALIDSGALDLFHPEKHRAALFWEYSVWRKRRPRRNTTGDLFPDTAPPPDLPADDLLKRLRREFKSLGFLCECHPMRLFADRLKGIGTVKAGNIPAHAGRRVCLAGWLITGKTVFTQKGDPMRFVTFEDETGIVETTFFPGAYKRFRHILDYGRPYLLSGKVEKNHGAATLTVDEIRPL